MVSLTGLDPILAQTTQEPAGSIGLLSNVATTADSAHVDPFRAALQNDAATVLDRPFVDNPSFMLTQAGADPLKLQDLLELPAPNTQNAADDRDAPTQTQENDLADTSEQDSNDSPDLKLRSPATTDQNGDANSMQRFAALRSHPAQIRLDHPIAADEKVPENRAAQLMQTESPMYLAGIGQPIPIASREHTKLCHQPLYFEELNLERCGRVDCRQLGCLQNAYSTWWFLTGTAILPYRLATQPHCHCIQGSFECRTCQQYDCPIEPLARDDNGLPMCRGLVAEAAAIAGFTFLLL